MSNVSSPKRADSKTEAEKRGMTDHDSNAINVIGSPWERDRREQAWQHG
jgi:hypothetical protein